MRITDVTVHTVNIPLEAPTLWIGGVNRSWTRTIVRMRTDEGIEGIAETGGGHGTRRQLELLKKAFIGEDPFNRQKVLAPFWYLPGHEGLNGMHAVQALETACWDIIGKALDRPLCQLLGGRLREHIPAVAYVMYRLRSPDGRGGERSPQQLVEHAQELVEALGVGTIKLKGGVLEPDKELAAVRALRAAFPDHRLRFDPNALWSAATAVRLGRQLEELELEWYEDPTSGLEAIGRVRQTVRIPIATNMYAIGLHQLASAIRHRAVDVELLDLQDWGGIVAATKGAATCEAFGVGVGLHSHGEAGIYTALCLHVAAALPTLPYAIDSFYHHQLQDLITEPHRYVDGGFQVPSGPGLGVEIDEDKLRSLERLNQEEGDRSWYEEQATKVTVRRPGAL
jgi:glucarate dehydratase